MIAVIITGELRTLDKCLPNLDWNVFRHYKGAKFFVSTVNDKNASKVQLLKDRYDVVDVEVVDKQPDFPDEKKWTPGEFYTHEPYAISVSPEAILRQLWQLEQGWNLFEKAKLDCDTIIRCRPDLWFHNFRPIWNPFSYDAHVPGFGTFGGVNDRFAVLGKGAAMRYFTTFSQRINLWDAGCPFHPESMVKASLEMGKCFCNEHNSWLFSTLRENGQMRSPELTQIDILRR